jgi:hypothetical protein
MHPLLFVTSNANKAKEVKAILGDEFAVEVVAFDAPEIQGSIEDIAQDKYRRVAESVLNFPVLTPYLCLCPEMPRKVLMVGMIIARPTCACRRFFFGNPSFEWLAWALRVCQSFSVRW